MNKNVKIDIDTTMRMEAAMLEIVMFQFGGTGGVAK
jgi:pseudouridine-5'-phosphate glycosidase